MSHCLNQLNIILDQQWEMVNGKLWNAKWDGCLAVDRSNAIRDPNEVVVNLQKCSDEPDQLFSWWIQKT